jgi:serine/threonine-protein kinase
MQYEKLGRYRIVAELGRGAMGAVYRAVDPLIEREVAIKTLLDDLPAEILQEVRERFLREARSAGRLNHPNIVTIFDVGEDRGVAYIAMELLEGRSLQQIMRSQPRTPCAAPSLPTSTRRGSTSRGSVTGPS